MGVETTIKIIIEMTIMEEVEVGLGKDNMQVILEGMIKAVVDQDEGQEAILIETELDVLNVDSISRLTD